jgi:hypothetical protein
MADFLTIAHEVADFDAWKGFYDADGPRRAAAGLTELLRLRETEKPYLVALVFAVTDAGKALALARSPELAQSMKEAGVIGVPFAAVRRGAFTPMPAATYLTLNCKVSSFETFRAGYAMDAAERQAAGLTDLGVLQKPEDACDLFLIWSVEDVAKAQGFLTSPELAKHQRKNAGLVGGPVAHFWTAV